MSNTFQTIDYAALANALLRAAPEVVAGAGADSTRGVVEPRGAVSSGAVVAMLAGLGKPAVEELSPVSWADEVQESKAEAVLGEGSDEGSGSSGGSVTFDCEPPAAVEAVRSVVKFGGFGDNFEQAVSSAVTKEQAGEGYYAGFVRDPSAVALRERLESMVGVKFPKAARADIAVCSFTAGVMPSVAVEGKKRLKALAAVGDAAITTFLVTHVIAQGRDVESAQAARSKCTSNVNLRTVMAKTGLVRHVRYPSGVDSEVTKATATAFEAIVGVLFLYRPPLYTQRFLLRAGVFVGA